MSLTSLQSRVLLNGCPGPAFPQGEAFDTLSPILLIMDINQLHHLIRLAAHLVSSYWSGQEQRVAAFHNTPKILASLPTPTKMSSLQLIPSLIVS